MTRRTAPLIFAVCFACAAPRARFELQSAELVDLTWPFDQHTLYWPTAGEGFALTVLAHGQTPGGWFYAANALCTAEHGGTHLDAPIHFAAGQTTVEHIPLARLIAPAVVVDVVAQAEKDPDYLLTAADLTGWEREHGRIERGTIVLLRTGWGRRWPDRKAYFGDDTPGAIDRLHFPSFGADAARLLVDRGVAAIGVDTASIDRGASRDFMVHRVTAAAGVPGFENVANLERVPARGAWVFALPMKVGGGTGGPLRIVAALPRGRRVGSR